MTSSVALGHEIIIRRLHGPETDIALPQKNQVSRNSVTSGRGASHVHGARACDKGRKLFQPQAQRSGTVLGDHGPLASSWLHLYLRRNAHHLIVLFRYRDHHPSATPALYPPHPQIHSQPLLPPPYQIQLPRHCQ